METTVRHTRLALLTGDITRQETEAIVNAANSGLMGGGGVDGAIHHAGGPVIHAECLQIVRRIGSLPPGEAVITSGGFLKAKYVIHTVGPIWQGGSSGEAEVLAKTYRRSLDVALQAGVRSISFPSISTGAYRYPVREAARVALETVADFLQQDPPIDEVVFVLYDEATYRAYCDAFIRLLGRGDHGLP